MAALFKVLFGGATPSPVPQAGDSDFADFAGAADPTPAGISAIPSQASFSGAAATATAVPYTKWYNVHERHSLSEFRNEGYILIIVAFIIAIHLWGTRTNRAKAKAWKDAHAPALEKEFALVGFGKSDAMQLTKGSEFDRTAEKVDGPILKEKSLQSFSTYATGRQNIAFVDVNLSLFKRFNPLSLFAEFALGFFFESFNAPAEKMEATLYPFDGKEALTVPGQIPGAAELRKDKSAYDNFVWAVVNKDVMKTLRDERYDVSITLTKDHPKLPNWCTVMSESAEVTELLLTDELVAAVTEAGDLFEYLIVSDQPIDKPITINETAPKKRIYLSTKLSTASATVPIFSYFLRLTDQLAASAHFRPEVMRKVKTTRDDTIRAIQRKDEEEKNEERNTEREKAKKLKRELELKGLDAKAQKKYLEKESIREQKKMQKKQTMRG